MTRTMDNAIATLHPFPGSAVRGDGPEVDAGEPSTSVSVRTRSRVPSVVSTAAPVARG